MEHGGLDMGQVNDLLAWFKATPVAPFVRVPSSDYHFIARLMDLGALGVMVPNVKTPEQAKQVVDAVRYTPDGERGLGLGCSHNDFERPKSREYMHEANRNNMVICQIESTTALDNLEAIASTPGRGCAVGGALRSQLVDGDCRRIEERAFRRGAHEGGGGGP